MGTTTKQFMLFFIAGAISIVTDAQVNFEWNHLKDGGMDDQALAIGRDDSHFTHIAGTSETPDGVKLYTRKYNGSGDKKWTKTGNTYLSGNVLFMKMDASFNTFIVCENPVISGYTIFKYGVDGRQRWKKDFTERPVGLEINSNGKVVYTGGQAAGGFFARAYRANDGHINWARSEGQGIDARAMDIDNSGNVIVGGVDGAASGDEDIRIVKFGISSYSFIWAANYNGDDNQRDNVHLLTVDKFNNVYISGEINAYGSMGANISMAKFNSSGTFQWQRFVTNAGGAVSAFDQSLLVGPDNDPVVVGQKNDFYNISLVNVTSRIFVAKLNRADGTPIFLSYPDDPTQTDENISEAPVSATIDQYNNIYVGGFGNQTAAFFTDRNWLVTKIDGDGHNPWIAMGNIPGQFNRVNDLYVSQSGSVYCAITTTSYTKDFFIQKLTQPAGGFKIPEPTEANEITSSITYNVYPNPSVDKFTITHTSADEPVSVYVYDETARLVKEYKNIDKSFEFGEELAAGSYYIELICAKEKQVKKLIKSAQ